MEVQKIKSPVFGAKYISPSKIAKYIPEKNNYSEFESSFVKIDTQDRGDIWSLGDAVKYWPDDKFGNNIYIAAQSLFKRQPFYKGHEFYALTSQKSGYEKLDPDRILGLLQLHPYKRGDVFVDYLQINPDYIYKKPRLYLGVGSGILNSLKGLCERITLIPSIEKSVKDFYIKNGFCEFPMGSRKFIWQKEGIESF